MIVENWLNIIYHIPGEATKRTNEQKKKLKKIIQMMTWKPGMSVTWNSDCVGFMQEKSGKSHKLLIFPLIKQCSRRNIKIWTLRNMCDLDFCGLEN